jgi:hypothetical protein
MAEIQEIAINVPSETSMETNQGMAMASNSLCVDYSHDPFQF